MSMVVTGNSVDGDLNVDVAKDCSVDVAFTNNLVRGDANIISSEAVNNVFVNGCGIKYDLEHMSPEVWFMYHNIYIDKQDIGKILDAYKDGKVNGLRFKMEYRPEMLTGKQTIGVVVRCLEFLKKHACQKN